MIKKYILASLLGIGFAASAGAQANTNVSDTPIQFQATFSSDNVAHTLFQPGATDAPHPFYAQQCAASPAPVDFSQATGTGTFSFDPKTHTLTYTISYSGLSGAPLMAHFHYAAASQEGPIVQTICGMPPKNSAALGFSAKQLDGESCPTGTSGTITGSYKLQGNPELKMTEAQEVEALMNGDLYINFHTCLNEQGEIRGQLVKMS
jgi:hypothetical protein